MISALRKLPMTEAERDGLFQRLRCRILEFGSPTRIIVFGSYATNSVRVGSDLDVCVLFVSEAAADESMKRILSVPPLLGLATDYLFMSEDRFRERAALGGVCAEITEKGITIFDGAMP